MFEVIIAVCAIVAIKHLIAIQGPKSKSFTSNEVKELIESRSQYRARARACR